MKQPNDSRIAQSNDKRTHCLEYEQLSRRDFLAGSLSASALFVGQSIISLPASMPRISLADPQIGPRGDTLLCIFLRGGADGLNIVVPHGDDDYYHLRPTIGIPRPDDRADRRSIDLDGFFGLHPALDSLHEIYTQGDLAIIQATGSPDETRSHFEAMALMERGAIVDGFSGWIARHLATLDTGNGSALRAIGIGDMLPTSLNGSVGATALRSIADYHLQGRAERIGNFQNVLRDMYERNNDFLSTAAVQTFNTLDVLDRIDSQTYRTKGRPYPDGDFGQALLTVAQLVKAEVGLEVACIDIVGWDTHVAQGGVEGHLGSLLSDLDLGLAAFYEDIQDRMGMVTVVIMSEFGRRARENGGLGTDHGHGNMMMVMGGGVNGGRVYGDWPGLSAERLVGPGDLAITTDFRSVLAEILIKRLNNSRLDEVFPGFTFSDMDLVLPRNS